MKKIAVLGSAILIQMANPCVGDFHGALTAMTNYVYRGYSKSNDKFAYQANIDYEHQAGGYWGATISSVNFGDKGYKDPAQVEIAPYLGWSFGLPKDWRVDLQWTRYWYDGNIFGLPSDYNEFYLLVHYRDLLSANVSLSENYYSKGKPAGNYQLIGRYPVTDYLQISSSMGYSQTKSILEYDYLYWNAGFTFFYKVASLDFRYVDAATIGNQDYTRWQYNPSTLKPSFLVTLSVGF